MKLFSAPRCDPPHNLLTEPHRMEMLAWRNRGDHFVLCQRGLQGRDRNEPDGKLRIMLDETERSKPCRIALEPLVKINEELIHLSRFRVMEHHGEIGAVMALRPNVPLGDNMVVVAEHFIDRFANFAITDIERTETMLHRKERVVAVDEFMP